MNNKKTRIKLSLVQKLVASYAAIAFFTLAALLFSITGLYSITRTARDMAHHDLLVISSAIKLHESLVAQERASGKYAILKSPEFIGLFHQRQKEFLDIMSALRKLNQHVDLASLADAYSKYQATVEEMFKGETGREQDQKKLAEYLLQKIEDISLKGQQQLDAKLAEAERNERSTVRLTLLLSFTGFLLAIGVAAFVVITISAAIGKLKKATHRIAEGDFDYDPRIPPGDEIGDLAHDFTSMAGRLKVLEQMSLDASPLTRLPGNIAIERVLGKRLNSGEQFAVCYADLDNFKAYNDRYGYIKASEVIKITAEIIHQAVDDVAEDSFIGHVGGDDFVIVTDTNMAAPLCEAIITRFDEEIRRHYSEEDLARGAIEGNDRYGVHRIFPIMTISIAAVICEKGIYDSAVDIAKTAADLKEYLKGKAGSNFFVNRRFKQR